MCGCGMVHPAVFEEVNRARGDKAYDPEKWTVLRSASGWIGSR